jgi:leader peptidase (prepilin peptidase)/N-methyltransferase
MPLGLSLAEPRRSFCPSCKKTIPWYENLPLVSWLALRGRCSTCGEGIAFRYFLVELLTAVLFWWVWESYGFPLAVPYWVFISLLVTATFIDLEHFIIPDEITWGGVILGVGLSIALPEMMETSSRFMAAGLSLGGAAFGFGLLFLVVEAGKWAFGKIKHRFPDGEVFEWQRHDDEAEIHLGPEKLNWIDVFSREKDVLTIELDGPVNVDGREITASKLNFHYNQADLAGETFSLDSLSKITGRMRSIVIPREAMGFGDVKFIACIGAFLGWQAVLFTLFSASVIGSLAGVAGMFLAKDRAGTRIPFGPFLALGAIIWIFGGRLLAEWYFSNLPHFRLPFEF